MVYLYESSAAKGIFENIGADCDLVTKIYLKHMEEGFVKPYLEWRAGILVEADIAPDILKQMQADLFAQRPSGAPDPKAILNVLPPDKQERFADRLPDPEDSGPVKGYEEKAKAAMAKVNDPKAKKSLMQLFQAGLKNPTMQQLALTGLAGAASVGAAALTGGSAPLVGGLVGGLVGIARAKMAGKDWKDAAKAGMKAGALGLAAGAIGGLAGQMAGSMFGGSAKAEAPPTAEQPPDQARDFAFSPERTPGAPEGGFTKPPETPSVPVDTVTTQDLYKMNRDVIGSDPDLIKPGQTLKFPDGSTYKVERGDTLSDIAHDYSRGELEQSPPPMPPRRPKNLEETTTLTEDVAGEFFANAKAAGYSDEQIRAIFAKHNQPLPASVVGTDAVAAELGKKEEEPAAGTTEGPIKTGNPKFDAFINDMLKTKGKDAVIKYLNDAKPKAASTKDTAGINTYMQNWTKSINAAKTQADRIELAKEMVRFLADRKGSPEAETAKTAAASVIKRMPADAIGRTMRNKITAALKSGTMMEMAKYKIAKKLLETAGLRWKDLGLRVILSEAISTHVILIAR